MYKHENKEFIGRVMSNINNNSLTLSDGHDLREVFRVLGPSESLRYAREFIERNRRIHQYAETYARRLAESVTTTPLASQQRGVVESHVPQQQTTAKKKIVQKKACVVSVEDALGAMEHCRGILDKSDAKRKPDEPLIYDALCTRYPDAPRLMGARAVLDAVG